MNAAGVAAACNAMPDSCGYAGAVIALLVLAYVVWVCVRFIMEKIETALFWLIGVVLE